MARLTAVGLLSFVLGVGWAHGCLHAGAQSPEVAEAIADAARTYGVSEGWLRRIARCESGFRPGVTSRGGHAGLYQFAWPTWAWMSRQAGYEGTSPYEAWPAAHVAAWALSRGYARHWSCA